jgi:hypothetical protein
MVAKGGDTARQKVVRTMAARAVASSERDCGEGGGERSYQKEVAAREIAVMEDAAEEDTGHRRRPREIGITDFDINLRVGRHL